MIEITYLKEEKEIETIPIEVREVIKGILKILEDEYGVDRDKYNDNGGYVIVVESEEDFKEILEKTYINCNDIIPEYVYRIECEDGSIYTNSFILCNNDYSISLIIPLELTAQNLRSYMNE